jgi:hypothetical protein
VVVVVGWGIQKEGGVTERRKWGRCTEGEDGEKEREGKEGQRSDGVVMVCFPK